MGETLSRRNFLKAAGFTAAGAAAAGSLSACKKHLEPEPEVVGEDLIEEQEFTCTCSWSCSFCQYHVYTRNGNVAHMLPKEGYTYRTCLKGRARIVRPYSETRIQYPMKRVHYSLENPNGELRGKDEWERITWEEAGELIGAQWKKTSETYGDLANTYYQGCGSQGSLNGNAGLIMRLFNATGCTKWDYSFDNATNTGLTRAGIQWFDQSEPQDFVNSDYIFLAGANPVGAQIQMWQHIANAQEAGCKLVCLDPFFSPTVAKADKWITVKPGTDPALFNALTKRFIDEGTYNADFVLNHTCAPFLIDKATGNYVVGPDDVEGAPFWVTGVPQIIKPNLVQNAKTGEIESYQTCTDAAWSYTGSENYITAWDMFKAHLETYTFEYAQEITGITKEDFDFLYEMLQPKNKVAHYINFGGGAYENGLHQAYSLSALIAMTGNFGEPGRSVGGFDEMYGNFFGHALCAPSNGKMFSSITWLAACDIMDSGKLGDQDYPIKDMILSHGGLIGGSVNSNRTKDFLRKLEQFVVIDPWMTDSARMADIVLPACDMYEYLDVVPLSHEKNVRISEKCIDPMYESKPDSEIARFLAPYLGVEDAVCDVTDEDWWKGTFDDVAAARENGITLETLKEKKDMRYVKEFPYIGNVGLTNFITTTGRLYFYVDQPYPRTASNYDTAAVFDREKMPTYFENRIGGENSEYKEEFPLTNGSWRNPSRVHMTHFMGSWAKEVLPEPVLFIHPDDAKKYGIEDGSYLKATATTGGHCVLKAAYHVGMRPGSTVYYKGYSEAETKSGSQGAITTDYADAYAVNCSFLDNRIKVEPWDGKVEE